MKDHLEQAVSQVAVLVSQQRIWSPSGELDIKVCPERARSQSEGLAIFVCNTPATAAKASLTVRNMPTLNLLLTCY